MQKHSWSFGRVMILIVLLLELGILLVGAYQYLMNGELSAYLLIGLGSFLPVLGLAYWGYRKGYTPPVDATTFPSLRKVSVEMPSGMTLASPGARIGAFVVDRIISLILVIIGLIPFVVAMELNNQAFEPTVFMVASIMFMIVVSGVGAFYLIGRDIRKGQSVGRRLLKIRVVQEDGQLPVKWWRAIMRDILLRIQIILVVEVILLFADKQHRRLGDRWMKTIVVSTKESESL